MGNHSENNEAQRIQCAVELLERALPFVDRAKDAFPAVTRNALKLALSSMRGAIELHKLAKPVERVSLPGDVAF